MLEQRRSQLQRQIGGRQARRWTRWLVLAQSGQPTFFGRLLCEMEIYLVGRLRCCEHTRAVVFRHVDLQDILQDAALKAWRSLATFDASRGSATSWLWRITHNCAVDLLRHRGRHREFRLDSQACSMTFVDLKDASNPCWAIETKESMHKAKQLLEAELAALEVPLRRALELRWSSDKTYAEIALELGITAGRISGQVHRLKKRFCTALMQD